MFFQSLCSTCQVPPPFFYISNIFGQSHRFPVTFSYWNSRLRSDFNLKLNSLSPSPIRAQKPHLRGWGCGLTLPCPHCSIWDGRFIWRSVFRIISLSSPTHSQFPVPAVLGLEEKERQRPHDPDLREAFLGTWTSPWHPYPCLFSPLGSLPLGPWGLGFFSLLTLSCLKMLRFPVLTPVTDFSSLSALRYSQILVPPELSREWSASIKLTSATQLPQSKIKRSQ